MGVLTGREYPVAQALPLGARRAGPRMQDTPVCKTCGIPQNGLSRIFTPQVQHGQCAMVANRIPVHRGDM